MNTNDRNSLRNACDTYSIPLPESINAAAALLDATERLLADVRAETAPDPDTLDVKSIAKLHAAMVAWPSHDDRLAAAEKLHRVADGKASTAWDGYASHLLEAFRKPFDDAVARYLDGDTTALATMQELDRVRDILANVGGLRAHCRSDLLERVTRILAVPDYHTALNRIRQHTEGLDRLGDAWCRAVIALDCQIKWQTPTDQEAADAVLTSDARPATAGV